MTHSYVRRGEEKGPDTAVRRPQNFVNETKMVGLYTEGSPISWAGEVRGVGGVYQLGGPCNR